MHSFGRRVGRPSIAQRVHDRGDPGYEQNTQSNNDKHVNGSYLVADLQSPNESTHGSEGVTCDSSTADRATKLPTIRRDVASPPHKAQVQRSLCQMRAAMAREPSRVSCTLGVL